MLSRSTDIAIFNANIAGKDYIIGDVHGNKLCLQQVIEYMHPNDRLFIVGDLVDRGSDSIGVLQTVMNINTVYSIRGNHEDMCLALIAKMENKETAKCLKKFPSSDIKTELEKSYRKHHHRSLLKDIYHMLNRIENDNATWIIELFKKELDDEKIGIKNKYVFYSEESLVLKIKNFIKQLPYIIHVKGTKNISPFHVVHADMPFSDAEVEARICEVKNLTEEEVHYAIWARNQSHKKEHMEPRGRTPDSIIAYCGHNVLLRTYNPCVRNDSNSVDLDIEMWSTQTALCVNHTDQVAFYIGEIGLDAKYLNQINLHLKNQSTSLQIAKDYILFKPASPKQDYVEQIEHDLKKLTI